MIDFPGDPLPPAAPLEDRSGDKRGRLKIFLGAASGVGKTHAMLETAIARKLDAVDVVVGFVDSHGRKEIGELLHGLEALKPLGVSDLDIDAILKRSPALVLADDLAHRNAGKSWHARRYEDIEHLLEAGIDVYTTLNIQEMDSLSDIVSQIVRITVNNTVPDQVVQAADEVELVDIAPPELQLRLKQGKVFLQHAEARDVEQYFTTGNLTALRELALRYMAERVDQQMLSYRQAHAITGVWPTRERIIVCVGDAPVVGRLIRMTKRIADRRKVPWIALYVETHRHANYNEEQRGRINEALRLAEQLGAELVTVAGEDPATEIMACAKTRNVTQIIVGKSERPRWMSIISPSVVDRLLHYDSNIDVLVVGPDNAPVREPADKPVEPRIPTPFGWLKYVKALYAVALASVISLLLSLLNAQYHNYAVIYLTAVILVAIRQGRGPAIFAAVLTAPVLHFLFSEDKYSFHKIYRIDPIALVVFFGATIIISNLAQRVRAQIDATRLSERRSKNLYDFNRKIASAAGLDDVLWAVVHHVASTIGGKAIVMMPKEHRLEISAAYPPEMHLDDISDAAADWAWRQGKRAGEGSNTLPNAEWLFLPLKTARGALGVLGVRIEGRKRLPTSDEARLLDTLADQAAVAIERTNLVSGFEETRILMETEKLRGALLSSLSHDLRTPLVSILGSATTLIDLDESLDKPAKQDLLQTIREEAERLNRFVQNLLDMTRLGSGALKPRQDWIEIGDVVGAALRRLTRQIGDRQVEVTIEPALPLLFIDFVLIEQVLVNIVENACKYSPSGSKVTISARRADNTVVVRTCDQGKGIPSGERDKVFDMFYRVMATDTQIAGTGLGLAICRGIVESHGGTIRATDADDGGGTCISFTLPLRDAPALDDADGMQAPVSEWDS